MPITEPQLSDFMRRYEEEFGQPIDREVARIQAAKLLQLVRLLLRGNST